MSIINDALKKVQANIDKSESQDSSKKPAKKKSTNIPKMPQRAPSSIGASEHSLNAASQTQVQHQPPAYSFSQTPKDKKDEHKVPRNKLNIIIITLSVIVCGIILLPSITYLFNKPQINQELPPVVYQPRIQRPTVPSNPVSTKLESIYVSGIVTIGNENRALINDKIYEEGDTIEGMKIMNISLDSIELLDGNKTKILEVR